MLFLHREVARQANKKTKRINHFFGGRYKWCLIQNENYFWNATKYIFQNPMKAFICKRVEEYPFSSFNTDVNFWHMSDFFGDRDKKIILDLNWLNQSFTKEVNDAIGKGLRRRIFKLPVTKNKKIVEAPQIVKSVK
jgi:hypothetical protein